MAKLGDNAICSKFLASCRVRVAANHDQKSCEKMCPRDCMALYGNVSAGERQKGDIFVFQRNMEQRLKRIDIRPHIALQNKYKNNTKQIQTNGI